MTPKHKAIQISSSAIRGASDETACYELSARTQQLILPLLEYQRWRTRWYGEVTDDEIEKWVADAFIQITTPSQTCGDCSEEPICNEYPMSAHWMTYAPNDPWDTPDFTPEGYLLPPWYHDPVVPIPGVLPTDVMVNFASIPVAANLPQLLESGLPRMSFSVQPAAELEIEFVKVPQGGYAMVTMDGDPFSAKFVNLATSEINSNTLLEEIFDLWFEGGLTQTEVFELDTPDDGLAHVIAVTFVPNVGQDIVLGFGGGMRRVSICAPDVQTGDEPMPQFQIVGCDLQWRPSDGHSWVTLGNVCGPEGMPGSPGAQGEPGPTGPQGARGEPGECTCIDTPPPDNEVNTRCNIAYGLARRIILDIVGAFQDIIAYPDGVPLTTYNPTTWAFTYCTTVPWLGIGSYPAMLLFAIGRVGYIADDGQLEDRYQAMLLPDNAREVALAIYRVLDWNDRITGTTAYEIAQALIALDDPDDIFATIADWIISVPVAHLAYLQMEASVFEVDADCDGFQPPASVRWLSTNPVTVSEQDGVLALYLELVMDEGYELYETVHVTELTFGGTAVIDEDYTVNWQAATFGPGSHNGSQAQVLLYPVNDSSQEGNETVTLTITGVDGGATIGSPSSHTVTIIDDDEQCSGTVIQQTTYDDRAAGVWSGSADAQPSNQCGTLTGVYQGHTRTLTMPVSRCVYRLVLNQYKGSQSSTTRVRFHIGGSHVSPWIAQTGLSCGATAEYLLPSTIMTNTISIEVEGQGNGTGNLFFNFLRVDHLV